MSGGLSQLDHGLQGLDAVLGSVVAVHGVDDARVVNAVGQGAASAEEEGGLVPAGVDLEVDVLASGLAVSQDLLHVGGIGDDGLVVVQEVAVIGGQGVGVHGVAQHNSGHGAAVVLGLDDLSVLVQNDFQSASGHQTGQLILREAEDVSAGFHVGQHVGGSIAFANGLDLNGHVGVLGMSGLEQFDLSLGELNSRLGNPDLDLAVEAFGSSEGAQGQRHRQSQNQRKDLLHGKFLL